MELPEPGLVAGLLVTLGFVWAGIELGAGWLIRGARESGDELDRPS